MNAQPRTWIQQLRSKRDARYASKLQEQRFDALRRQPVRRGLVVGSFLLLLGAVRLVWGDASAEVEVGPHVLYLAAGLLFVAGMALLSVTVRAHWPDRALDERLVAVRNAAYRTSYGIVGVVTGLALLAISVAWETQRMAFAFEPSHLRALLLGFVGVAVMMPTAVLAWREREV